MKKIILGVLTTLLTHLINAQTLPRVESCYCKFKADSSLSTSCGYLLVPENRNNKNSKTIKLPYIFVSSKNPNKKKDPVLFTTGGPGGSSLNSMQSIHYFSFIKNRDFIAFEQRGTKYAQPCLECEEVNEAIKKSYISNTSKDSLVNIAVTKCRERLIAKGIDITGYNTAENTNDIEDLRKLLKIDSLNLIGLSYSGGLMMNVLKKYPNHIRSLILDSPLPLFVNIDEDELANFNEALHQVFASNEKDSRLEEKLKQYLLSIKDKVFTTDFYDETKKTTVKISYRRNELIDIIGSKISDEEDRKKMPQTVHDLIMGNHKKYIDEYLGDILKGDWAYSGMRLSVYCSDKMAYADQDIANQQYKIYPYMKGYNANDVTLNMCKCWNVQPISASNKKPSYSSVPLLLGAGSFDPACRPIYNDMIHHYFPNSQRLLFTKKAHGPLISLEGNPLIADFLDNPLRKIEIKNTEIVNY
jgi:pimeloyl-ACP methyl ester carboxylesterase